MRRRALCLMTLVCIAMTTGASSSLAGSGSGASVRFTPAEKCFMRKINAARREHGKRSLAWDPQVGYVARKHARRIAAERELRHDHNYGDEITRWKRLGQNTGIGPDCARLFRGFWRSESHRNNILGRWRHMAVGVARGGGEMYVQQVFESRKNPGNIY